MIWVKEERLSDVELERQRLARNIVKTWEEYNEAINKAGEFSSEQEKHKIDIEA